LDVKLCNKLGEYRSNSDCCGGGRLVKFGKVEAIIEGFPLHVTIGPSQGKTLYDFIFKEKPSQCLELGFAHGSSSCYIAAALQEIGRGHLTAVDLVKAQEWQDPSIEQLLSATGLHDYVTIVRENTSYTWFLQKKIAEQSSSGQCKPVYDFCFIDGPKHWTIDGLAFFLVDKLLKQDGWILFDDFDFTFGDLQRRTGCKSIDYISLLEMGEDELNTPHIEEIFRLLVMQHPSYGEFRIQDNHWAWAHKISSTQKKLIIDEDYTFKTVILHLLRKIKSRMLRTHANRRRISCRGLTESEA